MCATVRDGAATSIAYDCRGVIEFCLVHDGILTPTDARCTWVYVCNGAGSSIYGELYKSAHKMIFGRPQVGLDAAVSAGAVGVGH